MVRGRLFCNIQMLKSSFEVVLEFNIILSSGVQVEDTRKQSQYKRTKAKLEGGATLPGNVPWWGHRYGESTYQSICSTLFIIIMYRAVVRAVKL